MSQDYNKNIINVFFLIMTPLFMTMIFTIYYQLPIISGLIFIAIGLIFLFFRDELTKYIYFKTYDTSIRFHTGDLNERKKYPMTSYEEMKKETLSSIILKNKIAAIILIICGLFFVLVIK